jgi:hypothetical protein
MHATGNRKPSHTRRATRTTLALEVVAEIVMVIGVLLAGPVRETGKILQVSPCEVQLKDTSPLRIPVTVGQLPSQTISCRSSLAESKFHQAALTRKTLTDSSRLYTAAIERFNVLSTEGDMLPSFSNCSAQ